MSRSFYGPSVSVSRPSGYTTCISDPKVLRTGCCEENSRGYQHYLPWPNGSKRLVGAAQQSAEPERAAALTFIRR